MTGGRESAWTGAQSSSDANSNAFLLAMIVCDCKRRFSSLPARLCAEARGLPGKNGRTRCCLVRPLPSLFDRLDSLSLQFLETVAHAL